MICDAAPVKAVNVLLPLKIETSPLCQRMPLLPEPVEPMLNPVMVTRPMTFSKMKRPRFVLDPQGALHVTTVLLPVRFRFPTFTPLSVSGWLVTVALDGQFSATVPPAVLSMLFRKSAAICASVAQALVDAARQSLASFPFAGSKYILIDAPNATTYRPGALKTTKAPFSTFTTTVFPGYSLVSPVNPAICWPRVVLGL